MMEEKGPRLVVEAEREFIGRALDEVVRVLPEQRGLEVHLDLLLEVGQDSVHGGLGGVPHAAPHVRITQGPRLDHVLEVPEELAAHRRGDVEQPRLGPLPPQRRGAHRLVVPVGYSLLGPARPGSGLFPPVFEHRVPSTPHPIQPLELGRADVVHPTVEHRGCLVYRFAQDAPGAMGHDGLGTVAATRLARRRCPRGGLRVPASRREVGGPLPCVEAPGGRDLALRRSIGHVRQARLCATAAARRCPRRCHLASEEGGVVN
mmetsp:Transcript_89372/g.253230  ORF Transcript_89372/g.253230 Transcript_89372/m.253230 type:complete len:261 (-) Transcript_89372:674-1456(-)